MSSLLSPLFKFIFENMKTLKITKSKVRFYNFIKFYNFITLYNFITFYDFKTFYNFITFCN